MRAILYLAASFILLPLSDAQTIHWTALGDGITWSDGANWDLARAPLPVDSVVIDGATLSADSVVLSANAQVKNLLLLNDAVLALVDPGSALDFTGSLSYALRADSSRVYIYEGSINVIDVGNNEFQDRAIELLAGSYFYNEGICSIKETKGHGIRLESNSDFINNGQIDIHSEYGVGISVSTYSTFENLASITVDNAEDAWGMTVGTGTQFMNVGNTSITVSGVNTFGVRQINGGVTINTGTIDIIASTEAMGILIGGATSQINLISGIVDVQTTNATGITISGGLHIASGATLNVTGTPSDAYLDLSLGGMIDCQGVFNLE